MGAEILDDKQQYDLKNPRSCAEYWTVEFDASSKDTERYTAQAEKIVKRYLAVEPSGGDRPWVKTKVNLFTANVQTLQALLYGKTPKVDVKRRFADPNDDEARVAGEMLQRLLNCDIERDDDTYADALELALGDRLTVGLGVVRVRYEAEFEDQEEVPAKVHPETGQELAPAYTPEPIKKEEDVCTDYVFWRDFRWSPARTWSEVRWIAYRCPMTKEQVEKRFGKEKANLVPYGAYNRTRTKQSPYDYEDGEKHNPWKRAEIWEIWSKEHRQVFWFGLGCPEILDVKDDPLELEGFFPSPKPMVANLSTTKFIPTPDFVIAQDLYNEVDDVSSRITLLEQAVAVRGVYDKTSNEIQRLLSETTLNELIGIDNFSAFKEKGGLAAVVDWLPLDMIVGALDVLRQYRGELMALLFQVTGMSDIMRGQSSEKNVTATEQAIKAKFASVRVQSLQNEFARFASDVQKLKAEIIAKFYSPETIIAQSNAKYMFGQDLQLLDRALSIVKSDASQYRIEVKPEAVAMADMAAVKEERSEFLMSVATFLQSSATIAAGAPWATPYLLQLLQWAVAGFRGSSTAEGVLDQMVLAANQAAQAAANAPPQPNPEMVKAQMEMAIAKQQAQLDMAGKVADLKMDQQKNQMDIAKKQMELKLKAIEGQMKIQQQAHESHLKAQQAEEQHEMDRRGMELDHEMNVKKMESEIQRDAIKTEQVRKEAKDGGRKD